MITKLFVRDTNKVIEIAGSKVNVNTISEIGYVRAATISTSNIVFRDEIASLICVALILEPQDTFVDIGANVGLYSSVIGRYQYMFPNMSFYEFEANPKTAEKLKRTLNDKNTQVEVIGLSDSEGTIPFAGGAVSGVFGALKNASKFQSTDWIINIPTKRLDVYNIVGNSIVLKIDVEGHEWEVLQGATKYFDEQRIKAVYLDGFKDDRIPSFFENRGFVAFDGRSLQNPPTQVFSIMYLNEKWLKK
jgi:FkbM family methyltransferase